MQKIKIIIRFIGFILLFIALLFNPFLIKYLTSTYTHITFNLLFYILLIAGEICLIFLGTLMIIKHKKILKYAYSVILTIITIIICIFLTSLILKIITPLELEEELSSEFHHMYKPNQSGFSYPSAKDEFEKIEVNINELGMRDYHIPLEKKEKRILILGDSFIEAEEIPYEKTVGQLLQSKLGRENYLVMQQGYSSWSPLLYLNFLIKTYDITQQDHVIIVLCINDFYDANIYQLSDSGYTKEAIFDSRWYPLYFNISKSNKLRSKVQQSNLIKNFFILFKKNKCDSMISQGDIDYLFGLKDYDKSDTTKRLHNIILVENSIRLGRPYQEWDIETTKNVELSLDYIKKIKTFLEEKNASLTLLLTPLGWNIAPDETILGKKSVHYCLDDNGIIADNGIRERIRDFSFEQNITYIELKDTMKKFKSKYPTTKLFLQSDGHWSEMGHKLVSEILFNEIKND